MEEFDCLQSYVGVPLADELRLAIVRRSCGLGVAIVLQRVNLRPSMHQTRYQCFGYDINEQILYEIGWNSLRDQAIR